MTRRGAIVGLGAVARGGHLPGWRQVPGAAIVAAADATFAGAAGDLDEETGLPCYRSLDDLLEVHDVDFVDVCTPPSSHPAVVEQALDRGLDVLCEKPLAVTREGLERMRAARGDRTLVIVHNWKHAPILQAVGAVLRGGEGVGKVERIRWEVLRTRPSVTVGESGGNWRLDPEVAGGGILIDHGWHACYVLLDWMGVRPHTATARLESRKYVDLPVEDTADVVFEGDGVKAEMFLTWAAEERRNRAIVRGAKRELRMLDDRLELSADGFGEARTVTAGLHEEGGSFEPLSRGSSHPEWFAAVASELFDEMDHPDRRGRNLEVAATCFAMLEAAQASAASGRPEPIAP